MQLNSLKKTNHRIFKSISVSAVICGLAGSLLMASAPAAHALTIMYNFTDNAGTFGFGTLNTSGSGVAPQTVISGNLVLTTGAFAGTYNIFNNPSAPASSNSPLGSFTYDNTFFPVGAEYLDTFGLLFTGGGHEINIWGNSGAPYSYYVSDVTSVYLISNNNSAFTVTSVTSSVPEPGAVGLLVGTAVTSGIFLMRKRRK